MDSSKNNIVDFELLLQKQSFKKPSLLYNNDLNSSAQTYKPQDVIKTVYSQVKALQLADCVRSGKSDKDLKGNKSNFLPLNKLPVYGPRMQEVPKVNTHKFETQCFLDTQLLNIIDGATPMDTNIGMTQEFETTFSQNDDTNCEDHREKINGDVKMAIKSFVKENSDVAKLSQHTEKNDVIVNQIETEKQSEINHNIAKQYLDSSIDINGEQNSQMSKTAMEDTITFIENLPITQVSNEDVKEIDRNKTTSLTEVDIDTGQDTNISPSPVLKINDVNRQLSPFVVSLETFENFENFAMSFVKKSDFETAKHLINSQILVKELSFNDDTGAFLRTQRDKSPILDFKGNELQINSNELIPVLTGIEVELLQDELTQQENVTEKSCEILKDEILFSSDEEGFTYEESQNLPLTCALKITKDQPDILEKSMYVGFQTASNKCIQISRDSFEQAQTILSNNADGKKVVEDLSLTELVENCDKLKSKQNITNAIEGFDTNSVEINTVSSNFEDRQEQEHKKSHLCSEEIKMSYEPKNSKSTKVVREPTFNGFMTASNNKISISNKALDRCQKVFMDIDIKENFDVPEDIDSGGKIKTRSEELIKNKYDTVNVEDITYNKINDDIFLEEFENIEMSLEENESNSRHDGPIAFDNFKTASDKQITISKEAMAKSNNVLRGIDMTLEQHMNDAENNTELLKEIKTMDINQPSTSKKEFVGFKTANNKEIKLSDESLVKSKDIFKDIGKDKHKVKSIEDIICQSSASNVIFVGFKTANNKDIKISTENLSKTKNIFKDIDKDLTKTDTLIDSYRSALGKSIYDRLITSDYNNVKMCEDSLSKSNNITNDIPGETFKQCENELELAIKGFKTVSNDKDEISDLFTGDIRKQHSDILLNKIIVTKNILEDTGDSNIITTSGFKIANDIPVNTAEALEKNNKMFLNLDIINSVDKIQFNTNKKNNNSVFKGFQTANKKPVAISADALAKSKKIFKDIDESNDIMLEKIAKNSNAETISFHTANEKPVEMKKEALVRSEKINAFVGFKTASNKGVNISNEALEKCKRIFDDIEDIPITAQPAKSDYKKQSFIGFQTANKKKIAISKEAVEKTKSIFEDVNESCSKNAEKPFIGFQTANNNKVIVSKEALAKSRQLFQEKDSETDIPNKDVLPFCDIDENLTKVVLGFQTSHDKEIQISADDLKKSNRFPEKYEAHIQVDKKNIVSKDDNTKKDLVNIDKMLDTQVINDFEEDVCTEDFKDTFRANKRSGSPILVCPKAKKRKKFETPYKSNIKSETAVQKNQVITKPTSTIHFKDDYKKHKKFTLKDLNDLQKGKNTNIDTYILDMNLENILNFIFDESRNDVQKGKMVIDDLKHFFAEATDKKLIPDGWLDIHLKSILWKLISYEIRFPNALGKVCTVRNVIDQLKFRYDKELYNAERPVLRKILEKDEVPNKTMVLCIAGIYLDGISVVSATNLNNIELLLTDGWYFLKATIDNMLSKLVYDGKIVVGSKIVTCGAELGNCDQGVAPWEDTSSIRLLIFGNSTRPARWDEKLGLRPCNMVSRLASVRVGGGKVTKLRILVVRVYPRLYVEKFLDGSTVTRSERLEHQHQMKYETLRESIIEKIYEEVEKEMSDQDSQDSQCLTSLSNKRKSYDSGSQIAKMMKTSKDPMEFRAQLTSSQIHLLQDHVSKQRDKYLQVVQNRVQEKLLPRNVVMLARGRVVGLEKDGDRIKITKGMLSIWKPNEEVLDIFKEGSWIEVTNIVPTGFRNSEIQLSAGRQSVFRPFKCKDDIFKPCMTSLARTCYRLKNLSQNISMSTDYNEIDTVGIIFAIEPSNRDFDSNKNQFQNVYLADIDKNMICVNFWGGIKKFGYENILDTGQVIYCGNLQKRAGNTRKNIPQFRATEFAIFTKTPKNENGRELIDDMNRNIFGLDRRKFCEDCVAVKQNYSAIRCLNNSENVSPYRFNNSDYNLGKNKVFIDTPIGVKIKNKAEDFNLTGLDFESTFKQQDTQLSPKALERKKKVNEKIARLKMYGEPPPLSPINIINKSKNAANSYKSPLVKNETNTSNVSIASVNNLQGVATLPCDSVQNDDRQNLRSSPIISNISMNRTFVKRNINPVKLCFSENVIDKTVDHFAEEFDGSPPLSLE